MPTQRKSIIMIKLANWTQSIMCLKSLPEVVCIEESRKLLVHVDNMNISLAVISNHRLGPLAVSVIALDIDA